MPIFEEALEAYNLPLELKYLPVIESALNLKLYHALVHRFMAVYAAYRQAIWTGSKLTHR